MFDDDDKINIYIGFLKSELLKKCSKNKKNK